VFAARARLRYLLWLCVLFTAYAPGLEAWATDAVYAPSEAAVGVFGEPTLTQAEPDKTGTLVYPYPFALPAARGRPQPRLALDYNASTHDREAGYGWGLTLPVIERRPVSGFPHFDRGGAPVGDERYTFNGQTLVFICTVGSNELGAPGCGDEPQPTWASGGHWRYYRLQVEGLFARFYLAPDRKYWRVQLKGGEMLEFGDLPNGSGPGLEHVADNENAIVRWRLVRHSDMVHTSSGRAANIVQYRWKPLGARALLYLTDIYDTPPANGSLRDGDFAHHVQLDWQPHDFPLTAYANIDKAQPDLRLIRVAVASMPWSGNGPREVIRVYELEYFNARTANTFDPSVHGPLWHHSFLKSIRMAGHCPNFENEHGQIPDRVHCVALPATTFEYEAGEIGLAGAALSEVHGGPPNADADGRVFPYLNSVGIVDFNRDGLPDLLQSWEAEKTCYNHPGFTVIGDDGKDLVCEQSDAALVIRSARPMIGYANRGFSVPKLQLEHQCMDAGPGDGLKGLATFNTNKLSGFFTTQGSATLVGAWGNNLVAWGYAQYAPFVARPLSYAWLPPSAYDACDLFNFDEAQFNPAWRWEPGLPDWVQGEIAPSPIGLSLRWFADVDGDGLIDRFVGAAGEPGGDLDPSRVEFTRQFVRGEPRPASSGGYPVQVPFVWDDFSEPSLAPASTARGATQFYYVDVNGDGLVDLVTSHPDDDNGTPRVRPGNGRGRFACDASKQPWPCLPDNGEASLAYEIEVTGPQKPWPFDNDTSFHDVTGDGLADIVRYDPSSGNVLLWVNLDGKHFECVTPSCIVGKVVDDLHGTLSIGPHRLTFADMNGDGIDDLVLIAHAGVYVATLAWGKADISPLEGTAPRPGLLTTIHNGYGATTKITYQTVQQLDLQADGSITRPWTHHSPVVAAVVTELVMTSDPAPSGGPLPQPYGFERRIAYEYRDPAYDAWSHTLVGFRRIITKVGHEDAVTARTYWFGPCQNETIDAHRYELVDGRPQLQEPVPLRCPYGSDDDDYKSVSGRLIRIERLIPEVLPIPGHLPGQGERLLWSKLFRYGFAGYLAPLYERDDRRVVFSYAYQTDSYYYDGAQPAAAGGRSRPVAGGDEIDEAEEQPGRKHVRQQVTYDERGSLRKIVEEGAEPASVPDTATVTLLSDNEPSDVNAMGTAPLPCNPDWQCQPAYVSVWDPSAPNTVLRKVHYMYTAAGDVQSAQAWLEQGEPLQRQHEAGAAVAPAPPGQALARGWHLLGTLTYDAFGNLTRGETVGSASGPAQCSETIYDTGYAQLPYITREFTSGCSSAALETRLVFDRGMEQAIAKIMPNGAKTEIRIDAFGRTTEVYAPDPDTNPLAPATTLAATVSYHDRAPLSYMDVQRVVAPGSSIRSLRLFNALGEPTLSFDQGDGVNWTVSGWTESNASGRITLVRRPWSYSGDPVAVAVNATALTPTSDTYFLVDHDQFGRVSVLAQDGAGGLLQLLRNVYSPLAVETRDAEQLKAGGPHTQAFERLEYDGHGRPMRVVQHMGNPVLNDIVTRLTYYPTGEPKMIERTDSRGATYVRTMRFDTLGRLTLNAEPNTGNGFRYVWDDAGQLVGTSDARGCGENLYYDGLGRVVAEDYSPCMSHHAPYSPINLVSGTGAEVIYQYDDYEAGQVTAEPGFVDDPLFGKGRLVAVRDRGSSTWLNYDARGHLRRMSRQMAVPEATGTSSYAPHRFVSRMDYDLGGRMTRRSTGADTSELLVAGKSEETYEYSARGFLSAIDSSYGRIVDRVLYDADSVTQVRYGDAAGTIADFGYDERRRLSRYHVWRLPSPIWSTATPTYPLPDGSTTQTDLIDYRFTGYDDLDNPTLIEDVSTGVWPPYAATVKQRHMWYTDLYALEAIDYVYNTSVAGAAAPWRSPLAPEINAGRAVPMPYFGTRVQWQKFDYDGLGNVTASADDLTARYDRSLGSGLLFGAPAAGPNQLQSGSGLQARYDDAGNLITLTIERGGQCRVAGISRCASRFRYEWDEIGQLVHARRFDFDGNTVPPQATPDGTSGGTLGAELTYAYSLGQRVRKSATDGVAGTRHSLRVFDTMQVKAPFQSASGDYQIQGINTDLYLGGIGHVFIDAAGTAPRLSGTKRMLHLLIGDQLGSTTLVLDHATGEVVERVAYDAYGAVENDYRPRRWNYFREGYEFTGKESDIELGAVYFGARYYAPHLARWMSADPASLHGAQGDLNPYAYVGGRVMSDVDPYGLDACEGAEGICAKETIIVGTPPQGADPQPTPAPTTEPQSPTPPVPAPVPHPGPGDPNPDPVDASPQLGMLGDLPSSHTGSEPLDRGPVGEPRAHVRLSTVAKELWNGGVDALQVVGKTQPMSWYGVYKMDNLRFDIPQEPGDYGSEVAMAVMMVIPGPEGKASGAALGASRLHRLLKGMARFRRVTAVLETYGGKRITAVGSKSYMTRMQQAMARAFGYIVARHRPDQDVHAELRVLIRVGSGDAPKKLEVAGAKICPVCAEILKSYGAVISEDRMRAHFPPP
jgi:RHS repeat-associated protein